jgi:hypothetical protein
MSTFQTDRGSPVSKRWQLGCVEKAGSFTLLAAFHLIPNCVFSVGLKQRASQERQSPGDSQRATFWCGGAAWTVSRNKCLFAQSCKSSSEHDINGFSLLIIKCFAAKIKEALVAQNNEIPNVARRPTTWYQVAGWKLHKGLCNQFSSGKLFWTEGISDLHGCFHQVHSLFYALLEKHRGSIVQRSCGRVVSMEMLTAAEQNSPVLFALGNRPCVSDAWTVPYMNAPHKTLARYLKKLMSKRQTII